MPAGDFETRLLALERKARMADVRLSGMERAATSAEEGLYQSWVLGATSNHFPCDGEFDGLILGCNGNPITQGVVFLFDPTDGSSIAATVQVQPDGTFAIPYQGLLPNSPCSLEIETGGVQVTVPVVSACGQVQVPTINLPAPATGSGYVCVGNGCGDAVPTQITLTLMNIVLAPSPVVVTYDATLGYWHDAGFSFRLFPGTGGGGAPWSAFSGEFFSDPPAPGEVECRSGVFRFNGNPQPTMSFRYAF